MSLKYSQSKIKTPKVAGQHSLSILSPSVGHGVPSQDGDISNNSSRMPKTKKQRAKPLPHPSTSKNVKKPALDQLLIEDGVSELQVRTQH